MLWFAVTVVVPLVRHHAARRSSRPGAPASRCSEVLTLAHYRELFEYPNLVRGMVNTLGIGVIGGALAVAVLHGDRAVDPSLELAVDARRSTIW